jgi:hypothetical protein
MNISDDRLQKALRYLAETDEPAAKAKALVKALEQRRKTVKAYQFIQATGTMAEKEAAAYASAEYEEITEAIENAVADSELYANKRMTESLIVEIWRTVQANRRNGNIT